MWFVVMCSANDSPRAIARCESEEAAIKLASGNPYWSVFFVPRDLIIIL